MIVLTVDDTFLRTGYDIPLERKTVRQDPSVGGDVMNPIRSPIFIITAYAWVFSDTFFLQWDMDPFYFNEDMFDFLGDNQF